MRFSSGRAAPSTIRAIAVSGISAILPPMQHPENHTKARINPFGAVFFFCCLLSVFSARPEPAAAFQAVATAAPPAASAQSVDSYTIAQRGDGYRVSISYPQVGNPVADAELGIWAREQAAAFTDSVKRIPTPPAVPYELFITYETLKASSRVISVVFFINTAMGGAHPEPGMATFVYDRRDGRRLSYSDIFANQDGMPKAFSAFCRTALTEQLGDRVMDEMLEAGTGPDMANFDLFALVGNGVRVYFPPYQAAPYSEGYLNVTVPLDELADFKPHRAFWDKP